MERLLLGPSLQTTDKPSAFRPLKDFLSHPKTVFGYKCGPETWGAVQAMQTRRDHFSQSGFAHGKDLVQDTETFSFSHGLISLQGLRKSIRKNKAFYIGGNLEFSCYLFR
jgi:hypothetical protein